MKVVLRTDVAQVGKKGDIVDVSDGYGRNFLLPKGLAFLASDGVESQAAKMRASRVTQTRGPKRGDGERGGRRERDRDLPAPETEPLSQVPGVDDAADDGLEIFEDILIGDVPTDDADGVDGEEA